MIRPADKAVFYTCLAIIFGMAGAAIYHPEAWCTICSQWGHYADACTMEKQK